MKIILKLQDFKYGHTPTEKIEDVMDDWMRFKEDQYKDDGELIVSMKEINQRRKELKITEYEWIATWMLRIVKK